MLIHRGIKQTAAASCNELSEVNSLLSAASGRNTKTHSRNNPMLWRNWGHKSCFFGGFSHKHLGFSSQDSDNSKGQPPRYKTWEVIFFSLDSNVLSHVPWTVRLLLRILGLPFSASWCSPLVVCKPTSGCDEMVSWVRILAVLKSKKTWVQILGKTPGMAHTCNRVGGGRQTDAGACEPAYSELQDQMTARTSKTKLQHDRGICLMFFWPL